jgi:hypothetical protein
LKSPAELEEAVKSAGLEKPAISVEAGLPMVHGVRLDEALVEFEEYRRTHVRVEPEGNEKRVDPQLVREEEMDEELETDPAPGKPAVAPNPPGHRPPPKGTTPALRQIPVPPPAVPPPPPKAQIVIKPPPAPEPPPVEHPAPLAEVAVDPKKPKSTKPPKPGDKPPVEATAPSVAEEVPPVAKPVLKPFNSPPVKPVAKVLSVTEASGLVQKFDASTPTYLSGNFVVTGVVGQRVAMRTRESIQNPNADPTKPGSDAALVVVVFPDGTIPPAKDTPLDADALKGLRIVNVVRGKLNQITIVTEKAQ